jgi:hypothetical protein
VLREQHRWDLTVEEAVALQKRLREQVRTSNDASLDAVRSVAGSTFP